MDKSKYDDSTRRALHLFVVMMRCCNSVSEQSRQDIVRYDLSGSEFAVLELLYHKGPTPLGAVAEQVLLTSGSMTYVIDQLEKQGLVRRVACPADRRKLYADLTEAGHEKIASIFPGHAECLRQAMSVLNAQEQDELARLLKKLGLAQRAAKEEAQGRKQGKEEQDKEEQDNQERQDTCRTNNKAQDNQK